MAFHVISSVQLTGKQTASFLVQLALKLTKALRQKENFPLS